MILFSIDKPNRCLQRQGDLSPTGWEDGPAGHLGLSRRHAGAFRPVVPACDDASAYLA